MIEGGGGGGGQPPNVEALISFAEMTKALPKLKLPSMNIGLAKMQEKPMASEPLINLTAEIVAAHVANNRVAASEVGTIIERVHAALAGLSQPEKAELAGKSPVVSIRASLKPDYLICMECGRKQKTLKGHLNSAHNMTPAQYRTDYGLPATYPMTAPNYSEQRAALAKASGLGRRKASDPEATKPTRGKVK
jgi:predicted transcriptional regulator